MIRKGLSGGSFKPLTEESIHKIHHTAMRVIEEVGFEVNSESALKLFEGAGARVDRGKQLARLPRERVMELIETAPSEINLCGRDEKHDILLGGKRVYTGTGGTALYVYHPDTGQKQLATLNDLKRIARLVDGLDNIHLFMLPTYPSELPVEQVDVNRFFAGLDNTTKHVMGGVYTLDGVKQVIRMAEIVSGSSESLRRRPLVSMIACSISPLKMDKEYGDLLVTIAGAGIPLVCPAEPLCGATSPVTLAGNLVIQTVDSLMGVMLTQIINPGSPVIFGSVASSTDLRDLKYLAGSVEMGLLNAAGAQMAHFYKLPFYATGGMTDSKVLDSQSGYESAISGLLCALAGANFIHDAAGLMEFALTVSYEKFVIDNEILGMVMRAVEGIKVNDETLAFDLIKQVGPGGNFVTAKHTRRLMRSEHYQPSLSDRNSRQDWEAKGERLTWQRAAERVEEIMSNRNSNLPAEIRQRVFQEITGIVD
ncbi:trimethylamine methyltransferase family protein [Dehalococcoidia bacterium]|nr:trimethylamine methyltransferase family protein [Dehalococcoidia bacterium]MCL0063846.1 trimethylamine methyltransferase family protein [Dehalococcoidia bacterium]MCL0095161.1 trimethylamine methyltransferase family protein [Dehalococcoidia bacterium]